MRTNSLILLSCLCGPLGAGQVMAEVYKCVDAEGHVTYTNDKVQARGCKTLATDVPVSAAPAAPGKPPAASSAGFPKVSADQQKARDGDRRRILESELQTEQAGLEKARKALSEAESIRLGDERNYQKYLDRVQPFRDEVALHERNIEALRKELSNLP